MPVTIEHEKIPAGSIALTSAAQVLLDVSGSTIDLDAQSANKIFAGPASGGAAAPTFRSAVPLDLAASPANYNVLKAGSTTTLRWDTLSRFDVNDYGAAGDASADDTTFIQAAIDAANAAGGGVVFLRPLTYKITDDLVHKSNVLLQGCGYKSIIRQVTSGKHGIKVTPNTTIQAQGCGIDNVHFQSGHATAGIAINFGSVSSVRIGRIWIDGQTQNTHRWADGIVLYDASSSNASTQDVIVDTFTIMDIVSTATHAGIYVNTNILGTLAGPGSITFSKGLISSNYYSDGNGITTIADIGILVEGGDNITFQNVKVHGTKNGAVITGSSNAASYTRNASVPGGVSHTHFFDCELWLSALTTGLNAIKIRGSLSGFKFVGGSAVSFNTSGAVVDIDSGHSSDGFNSLYFALSNLNGHIKVNNTSGIAEDSMGPIRFLDNNYHGTDSGFVVDGGHAQKLSIIGGEIWIATTGLSVSSGSTALNFTMTGTRFYGCNTDISWNNTGAKDNVFIDVYPARNNVNSGAYVMPRLATAGRPASPVVGTYYFDTTLTQPSLYKTILAGATTPAWVDILTSDGVILLEGQTPTYTSSHPLVTSSATITGDNTGSGFGAFGVALVGYSLTNTVKMKTAGSLFGAWTAFISTVTIQNDTTAAVGLGTITLFSDLQTVLADGTTSPATARTVATYASFYSFPTFSIANSGRMGVSEAGAIYSNAVINTGVVMGIRRGLYFGAHSGSGSIQTQAGVDIGALTNPDITGTSSAATTTTMTDSSAGWPVNGLAGSIVTTNGKTMTVVTNTSTQVTGSGWSGGGTPTTPLSYTISTFAYGVRNADRSVQTKYARFGAVTAPVNVTDGDVTMLRLSVGNIGFTSGIEAQINGDVLVTGYVAMFNSSANPTQTGAGDVTVGRLFVGDAASVASGVTLGVTGNATITGWARVGSASAGTNTTTAGDLLVTRFNIGDIAFAASNVKLQLSTDAILNGYLSVGSVNTEPNNKTAGTITSLYAFIGSGSVTFATGVELQVKGDVLTNGWMRVGASDSAVPTQTAAGSLTVAKLFAGDSAAVTGAVIHATGDAIVAGYVSAKASITTSLNATAGDVSGLRGMFGTDLAIPAGGAVMFLNQGTHGSDILRMRATPQLITNAPQVTHIIDDVTTTTNGATTLHVFTLAANTNYMIYVFVSARRTGGSAGAADDGAFYIRAGHFKGKDGVTAAQEGSTSAVLSQETDQSAWDCQLVLSTNTVQCQVTGATNNNISWGLYAIVMAISS